MKMILKLSMIILPIAAISMLPWNNLVSFVLTWSGKSCLKVYKTVLHLATLKQARLLGPALKGNFVLLATEPTHSLTGMLTGPGVSSTRPMTVRLERDCCFSLPQ